MNGTVGRSAKRMARQWPWRRYRWTLWTKKAEANVSKRWDGLNWWHTFASIDRRILATTLDYESVMSNSSSSLNQTETGITRASAVSLALPTGATAQRVSFVVMANDILRLFPSCWTHLHAASNSDLALRTWPGSQLIPVSLRTVWIRCKPRRRKNSELPNRSSPNYYWSGACSGDYGASFL